MSQGVSTLSCKIRTNEVGSAAGREGDPAQLFERRAWEETSPDISGKEYRRRPHRIVLPIMRDHQAGCQAAGDISTVFMLMA